MNKKATNKELQEQVKGLQKQIKEQSVEISRFVDRVRTLNAALGKNTTLRDEAQQEAAKANREAERYQKAVRALAFALHTLVVEDSPVVKRGPISAGIEVYQQLCDLQQSSLRSALR